MIDLRPRRSWEDDDCVLFRAMVRKFFTAKVPPNEMRWREQKFVDRSFWQEAGELGILLPGVPAEFGGSGGDVRFDMIVSEELSYADGTSFIGHSIHGTITAHYILHYGTAAQKAEWLPEMARGDRIGALCMTEPSGGSDVKALRTTARRDGDHYVINGAKTFITNGILAERIIIAARTSDAPGARGISLIMLEAEKQPDGFTRGRSLDKIGMKGSDTAELFFNDLRVPVANLIGAEGEGFAMMMNQLPQERMGIAASAQGLMERAIELTVDYVRERQAFGQSVGAFQNTRFKLAECLMQARASRAFYDECVGLLGQGKLDTASASMAKSHTTDTMCKILDECVQLHGGYGFMEEYPVARMWADGRVQRIYGGTNEIMKEVIARALI